MKQRLLYLLLLTVALVTGSSGAWGATTTLAEYGTTNAAWSTTTLAEWTAGGSPALSDGIVTISGVNGSYATSKAITPTANAIINLKAVWRGRSNLGRYFSNGNGSYFSFGPIVVAQNDQDKKHGYGFTGIDNMASVTTFTAGSYRTDIANGTWLLIEAEINTATNTLTSFTIKSEDGKTTYVTRSNVVLSNPSFTNVAFGYRKGSSVSTTNTEQLKSLLITETTQAVQTANYTIKYVCNNTEIKDAAVRTSAVNTGITLLDSDKESFKNNGNTKKYIYVSDDAAGKTVNAQGTTIVTVTFREAATYNYTVNAVDNSNNIIKQILADSDFEGESITIKYPFYVNANGTLYSKGAIGQSYKYTFTTTSNNQVENLVYSATDITNVTYLIEGEDIEGATVVNTGNSDARSSQGASGYNSTSDLKITTLDPGKYALTMVAYSASSAGGSYSYKLGNQVVAFIFKPIL